MIFPVEAPPVDVEAVRAASDEGDRAVLLASDTRALFTAEVSESTPARVGQKLGLALNLARMHFFDPATGERVEPHEQPTASRA